MIPQPDVLNGAGVGHHLVRRQLRVTGQFPLIHPIECIRAPGGRDVVLDELLLLRRFVRADDESLNQPCVETAGDRHGQVQSDRQGNCPAAPAEAVPDCESRAQDQQHDADA